MSRGNEGIGERGGRKGTRKAQTVASLRVRFARTTFLRRRLGERERTGLQCRWNLVDRLWMGPFATPRISILRFVCRRFARLSLLFPQRRCCLLSGLKWYSAFIQVLGFFFHLRTRGSICSSKRISVESTFSDGNILRCLLCTDAHFFVYSFHFDLFNVRSYKTQLSCTVIQSIV